MEFKNMAICFLAVGTLGLLASCNGNNSRKESRQMNIIFETDLGNDVDDALAMDMLYKYADAGTINILGISINKPGEAPAELADIMNTWYGYPHIPIAVVDGGADCEEDAVNYAKAVADMKDNGGRPFFKRSVKDYSALPESSSWYRKTLALAPDSSVTIVSVGFSTNLARLLDTRPDKYSPLNGKDLVARKVRLLAVMGGCFNDMIPSEYNIKKDIPAAVKVFTEWPSPIVATPFEVGINITYPASSIENDFGWAGKGHPVVEAYKCYLPMPYDRPTWDLTALLYAVEGSKWFSESPEGAIIVDSLGHTSFQAFGKDEEADIKNGPLKNRRYLMTTPAQDSSIVRHFVEMISAEPSRHD